MINSAGVVRWLRYLECSGGQTMVNRIRVGLMQEWAHQDLNLEPADYESDALTN